MRFRQVISSSSRAMSVTVVVPLMIAIGSSVSAQMEPIRYPFAEIELPTLGGVSCFAWHSNNVGQVIGSAKVTGNLGSHAVLWDERGPHDLKTIGGQYSMGRGINEESCVVGWSSHFGENAAHPHPVLWRNRQMVELETPGSDEGIAWDINDVGQIVGYSGSSTHPASALLWDHGKVFQLPGLSDSASQPLAINNSGLIVGQSISYEKSNYGEWRPTLWDDWRVTDLGTLREDNTGTGWASDINEDGYVVGNAAATRTNGHAFIWYDGQMIDLDPANHFGGSVALAVNNYNKVVGVSYDRALYWDKQHGLIRLSALLPPHSRWRLTQASDINDFDEITAWAELKSDPDTRAYLQLFPVHPTMSLQQAVPGIAGQINTMTLSGATPGATVRLVAGQVGGGKRIPGCSTRQNLLQINSPTIVGTAVASANGKAEFARFIVPAAQGKSILLQAYEEDHCAISELVVQVFE